VYVLHALGLAAGGKRAKVGTLRDPATNPLLSGTMALLLRLDGLAG